MSPHYDLLGFLDEEPNFWKNESEWLELKERYHTSMLKNLLKYVFRVSYYCTIIKWKENCTELEMPDNIDDLFDLARKDPIEDWGTFGVWNIWPSEAYEENNRTVWVKIYNYCEYMIWSLN